MQSEIQSQIIPNMTDLVNQHILQEFNQGYQNLMAQQYFQFVQQMQLHLQQPQLVEMNIQRPQKIFQTKFTSQQYSNLIVFFGTKIIHHFKNTIDEDLVKLPITECYNIQEFKTLLNEETKDHIHRYLDTKFVQDVENSRLKQEMKNIYPTTVKHLKQCIDDPSQIHFKNFKLDSVLVKLEQNDSDSTHSSQKTSKRRNYNSDQLNSKEELNYLKYIGINIYRSLSNRNIIPKSIQLKKKFYSLKGLKQLWSAHQEIQMQSLIYLKSPQAKDDINQSYRLQEDKKPLCDKYITRLIHGAENPSQFTNNKWKHIQQEDNQ